MSQVEILRPINTVDYDLSRSSPHSNTPSRWVTTSVLVNDILSSSPLHLAPEDGSLDDHLFPDLPPLHHGHPELHLRNGVINASQLAAQNVPDAEKAFFVGDLSQVYRQHQRWRACLPEIQPFYAIKCNPDPYVLRLLAALGTGFDCASNGEINQVLAIGGIDPSRIVFANPCKAVSFVRNAGKVGVDMMTFDNADELHKVARAHPRAKLIIRILADDSKSICAFGVKFGAPLANVPGLLAKAKELNLNVVGVSFHVGSGCYDPSAYTDAIMRSRAVFDMGQEAGYTFNLLDVGGGFEDALFEQVAQYLTEAIDLYFPDRRDLKIIAEPGRFYVSRAFSLATNIIARRAPFPVDHATAAKEGDSSQEPSVMYYINDGVYGAFNCIMFDHQTVNPYVLSMGGSFHVPPNEPQSMSSVWGPTCDSIDHICAATMLPDALQVGDWLAFDNMGAYTICAASQFNGFETSHVVYTTGGLGGIEVRRVLAAFAMSLE
ncbi:ornithine decarboxylase [Desarmillaria ectypa]|nr:ornithine decarboxylase [Desarmillaria ectypa]